MVLNSNNNWDDETVTCQMMRIPGGIIRIPDSLIVEAKINVLTN